MLKNYKSSSALPNIFAQIDKTLTSHGAKRIVKDYDNQGRIVSISFVVATKRGNMAVRLPASFDRVETIFKNDGYRYKPDQPYRTAWATIRDWVDAQMALIDWDMVKIEEIFLPYMVDNLGKTYFQYFEQGKLQIQAPSVEPQEGIYEP